MLLALLLARPEVTAQTVVTPRGTPAAKTQPSGGTRLAITVDDLPGTGPEAGTFTYATIVTDLIRVLRAHGVRHAVGFVIGSILEGRPDRQAALDAWLQAGFEVGNHTYKHLSLATAGGSAYLADIDANRPLIESLEKRAGQRVHYFRPPFLDEGPTEADRRALADYLTAHDYQMARVSMDFADWRYAYPYVRCLNHGDQHGLALLQRQYLAGASAALAWSTVAAQQVVGHPITQVLLVHATIITSQMLDALLTAFDNAGVHYASLAEALSYDIYTAKYDVSGTTVFVQASHKLGHPYPSPPRPRWRCSITSAETETGQWLPVLGHASEELPFPLTRPSAARPIEGTCRPRAAQTRAAAPPGCS